MGAGRSLEAAYTLAGPIPAGSWRLVADGIVLEAVDVTFEILLRAGAEDTVLLTRDQHFEPLDGGQYRAQPYEVTDDLDEVAAASGDQLVLRFTGAGSTLTMAYIPNGDGDTTGGRIPFIELPRP